MTTNTGTEGTTDETARSGSARRGELARFLRAMRERLSPADAGVAVSSRRRARGLLREEVAQAAGISVTWHTWLEQGRQVNPSSHVLNHLSRVLRLSPTERIHLFRLVRPDLAPEFPPAPCPGLSAPLNSLLHGLAPHPAYAMNERWDVIAWNHPAARLLGAFDVTEPVSCNVLARLFLDPEWQSLFVDWEVIAEAAVRQFRAATVRLCADAEFIAFVQRLEQASPGFRNLWCRPAVQASAAWRKTIEHPFAGRLHFDFATFSADAMDAGVTFTIYTPADETTASRFGTLLAPAS